MSASLEQLSTWMENKGENSSSDPSLTKLSEEIDQRSQDVQTLLELSIQLQAAYSHLIQKIDHVDS